MVKVELKRSSRQAETWSIRRAAAGLSNHTQEAPPVNLTYLKASQAGHQRQGTHEEEVEEIVTMSAQGEPLSLILVDKRIAQHFRQNICAQNTHILGENTKQPKPPGKEKVVQLMVPKALSRQARSSPYAARNSASCAIHGKSDQRADIHNAGTSTASG